MRCTSASPWTNQSNGQQPLALLLAGRQVYCAGIPEIRDGSKKPALWILAAADGRELQRLELAGMPSIDGLSAVGGRLILTTADGQVLCFGSR